MKITVITVCFNAAQTLERTMQSVIDQTYSNIEYIIIDGGSTDGTVDIIKKYSGKLSYWISERDKGVYDAMNKGIKISTGEYINFMNSGDTFCDNKVVENVVCYLKDNPDVLYGATKFVYKNGLMNMKPLKLSAIKEKMVFCHQSSFVKTGILKEFLFDTNYKIAADYNLFYNMYNKNIKFKECPLYISFYDTICSMSAKNKILLEKEYSLINNRPLSNIKIIKIRIKNFLNSILPERIVLLIRKMYYE